MKIKNKLWKLFITKDITEDIENIIPWILEKFILFKYFIYNLFSSKYSEKRTLITMGKYWFLTIEDPIVETIKDKKILIGYRSKLIFFNTEKYYDRLLYLGLHPTRISLNNLSVGAEYAKYFCIYLFKSENNEKKYKDLQKKLKTLKSTKDLQIIFLDSFKINQMKRQSIKIINRVGYNMDENRLKNFELYTGLYNIEAYYNMDGELDNVSNVSDPSIRDVESFECVHLNPFTHTKTRYYTRSWYINGKLHRDDGPAVINVGITEEDYKYFYNGLLHRLDGPAIININNPSKNKYYRNGKNITDAEDDIYIKLKQMENIKKFKNKYSEQIKNLRVKLNFN